MDSRLKKIAILMAVCVLLMIIGIVALVNWPSIEAALGGEEPPAAMERTEAANTVPTAEDGTGLPEDGTERPNPQHRRIGADLSAFLQDETFFDPEKKSYDSITVRNQKRLSLVMTSVEKDLRIQVVDNLGKPVTGVKFKIRLDTGEEYEDDNKDGILYIDHLKPGEYQVTLEPAEGYEAPERPAVIAVKQSLEYVAIDDIELLILTEKDVDAAKEDTGVNGAAEEAGGAGASFGIDELPSSNANADVGIDVSKWNKEIDWEKVKEAGVEFAIIRCGYRGASSGGLIRDPYFEANMKGAADAGVPVGVYFFSQALDETEAVEEASMVIELCKGYALDYPVFIDSESAGGSGRADELSGDARTAVCQAFSKTIQTAGYRSGVYASADWLRDRLNTEELQSQVVWLAEYRDVPEYEGYYQIWQYTSNGQVDGIEGRVDLNLSYLNNAGDGVSDNIAGGKNQADW